MDDIRDTWNTHRLQSNDNGIGGGKRPISIYPHSIEDWESEFEGFQEQVKCCPAGPRLQVINAHLHPTRTLVSVYQKRVGLRPLVSILLRLLGLRRVRSCPSGTVRGDGMGHWRGGVRLLPGHRMGTPEVGFGGSLPAGDPIHSSCSSSPGCAF